MEPNELPHRVGVKPPLTSDGILQNRKLIGIGIGIGIVALIASISWFSSGAYAPKADNAGVALRVVGPCGAPTQRPWTVRGNGNTLVWTSPSGTLAMRSSGLMGTQNASVAGLLVVVGTTPGFTSGTSGTVTIRSFDPSARRADVSFAALVLRAPDGRSCILDGTIRAGR